jgi:hypothetical protein
MNTPNTTLHWLTTAFDNIVGFLPNLIAGLVILLLGWILAYALGSATRAIARRLHFDRHIAKLGVSGSTEAGSASRTLGSIVYGIVMLVAAMQAARAWQLDFVSHGLAAILAYVPRAVAAAVVFGIALYAGNFVRDRFYRARPIEAVAEGVITTPTPRFLPGLVRAVIIAVGVFMAVRELNIATEIVNAAFILTLGAVAVAAALAFGIGGREVAGRIAQSWWDRRSSMALPPTPGAPPRPEVIA